MGPGNSGAGIVGSRQSEKLGSCARQIMNFGECIYARSLNLRSNYNTDTKKHLKLAKNGKNPNSPFTFPMSFVKC